MSNGVSNIESDEEMKEKLLGHIMREICRKFREAKDKENFKFTITEIQDILKGWDSNYLYEGVGDIYYYTSRFEVLGVDTFHLSNDDKKFCLEHTHN